MTRKRTTQSAPNPEQVELDLNVDVFYARYPRDWLAGTFALNNRQRGALGQLSDRAWLEHASLPADEHLFAKYADESVEWLRSPEGQAVLAFWPIDASDGRRRNKKLAEQYVAAKERRAAAHAKATKAAEARWGAKRDEQDRQEQERLEREAAELRTREQRENPSPKHLALIGDREAKVAERLPTDHGREAFVAMLSAAHSGASRLGIVMEVGMLMDGGRGKCTPEQVERAICDYVANGLSDGRFNAAHFRGCVKRAHEAQSVEPTAKGDGAEQSEAGVLVMRIRGMIQTKGQARFIPKAEVEALGEHVLAAYTQCGGAERFISQKPDHVGFLIRDFELALKAANPPSAQERIA